MRGISVAEVAIARHVSGTESIAVHGGDSIAGASVVSRHEKRENFMTIARGSAKLAASTHPTFLTSRHAEAAVRHESSFSRHRRVRM
jgi:hypothetical protein